MYRVAWKVFFGLEQRCRKRDFFRLSQFVALSFFLPFNFGLAFAQSVVSDGGTATNITIGSSGLVTVDIAPADSAAISHNTYSSFSVPTAGVNLNNSTANASTILNEVTSANVTTINGPLTVIGQSADVVVANPNGITVNGGRFLNTGNVALTTGQLGRNADNLVTSTVSSGQILIGPGGLSGTMQELALLSKTLRVEGALSYDTIAASSHANIITGDGKVTFDRFRNGFGQDGSGLLPWALNTESGAASTDAVIVDISSAGSISAGRVSVTVTDQGAGVRFAGDQLASTGGFRLTSSGHLELVESNLASQGSINISAGSIELTSSDDAQAEILSENSGVTINANSGGIDLGQGRVSGRVVSSDNLSSSGGVTLISAADIIAMSDAGREAEIVSDTGGGENPQNNSNIVLISGGLVHFDGLRFSATDDFRVSANGAISFSNVQGETGGDVRILTSDALSFDASVLTAQSDIRLDGTALRFGADQVTQGRTELKAVNGGFVMRSSSGDILNYGSLLQGKTASAGDIESLGGMTINSAGDFVNKSLSVDRLAVAFGEEESLHITTAGDVHNLTGRLFSNDGIVVEAGGNIINETLFTDASQPMRVFRYKGSRFASSLFLRRKQSTLVFANFGDQEIQGEQSFILGVGDVSLSAQNIVSRGADITGGKVDINAVNNFTNEARQIGRIFFSQSCKLFCSTSGMSTLRLIGGTVTASDELKITAGSEVSSIAGSFVGANGLTISAPLTQIAPLFSLSLIEHPAGLTGLFSDRRGYLEQNFIYGSLQAGGGDITINGDADLGAANLFTFGEVEITGNMIESAPPIMPEIFERRPIGIFWNLFE